MGHARSCKVVRRIPYIEVYQLRVSRDEWAKHKDLNPYEAKWRYVEALRMVRMGPVHILHENLHAPQVLKKYSDRTIANQLVEELDSYGGEVSIGINREHNFPA